MHFFWHIFFIRFNLYFSMIELKYTQVADLLLQFGCYSVASKVLVERSIAGWWWGNYDAQQHARRAKSDKRYGDCEKLRKLTWNRKKRPILFNNPAWKSFSKTTFWKSSCMLTLVFWCFLGCAYSDSSCTIPEVGQHLWDQFPGIADLQLAWFQIEHVD